MKLREALIQQAPSLALQRAAADEIARLDAALAKAVSTLSEAQWVLSSARYSEQPMADKCGAIIIELGVHHA